MPRLMLIAVGVMLASCSRPVSPPATGFAEEIAGRIAGPAETCISSDTSSGLRAIDAQTLAYGNGRTIYINRLDARCPGITPTSTLLVEVTGTQYCRGDRVRGREAGGVIPGPTCVLGEWVPYTRPQ